MLTDNARPLIIQTVKIVLTYYKREALPDHVYNPDTRGPGIDLFPKLNEPYLADDFSCRNNKRSCDPM